MTQWTCTATDASTTNCSLTAIASSTMPVFSYDEALFIIAVFLFFVSLMSWGRIFGVIKFKKEKK